MKIVLVTGFAFVGMVLGSVATAEDSDPTKPQVLMERTVAGMPTGEKQEVSVLTATFKPGAKAVIYAHRFPVTVYIIEGAFTIKIEGRPEVSLKSGEAYLQPSGLRMTGFNSSSSDILKVVIFYVSDPHNRFLDPMD